MQSVTVTREIERDPDEVRAAMADVGEFMRASGFDDVTVDGDTLTIANSVGLATIELVLDLFDDPEAVLAYEHREGIFDEMVTRYFLEETADGVEVSATTDFALQARLIGPLLDATVIKRQRRVELTNQFDWLESGPA
ncbi:SRPBCC family protein [Halomicrobium zhouii]|nr:SRPBCC family protein [Halomicrobium zhouii]